MPKTKVGKYAQKQDTYYKKNLPSAFYIKLARNNFKKIFIAMIPLSNKTT